MPDASTATDRPAGAPAEAPAGAPAGLPEIRTPDGRLLLPASPLVPAPPRTGDPAIWERLITAGLVSPPDPARLVTPRTGLLYQPDTWHAQQVHWHGHLTTADPTVSRPSTTRKPYTGPGLTQAGTPAGGGTDDRRAGVTVLRSPTEALAWLDAQLRAIRPHTPAVYRRQAELDDRLDGAALHTRTEYDLVQLCLGKGAAAGIQLEERLVWEAWAEAYVPTPDPPPWQQRCTSH